MSKLTLKTRRAINKKFREKDDSHLWPICGEFNATDRAIRRLRRYEKQGLYFDSVYCYEAALEQEISNIVNGVK